MSHKTLRRFHGYDYSRGGSMFVSIHQNRPSAPANLPPNQPLYGAVGYGAVGSARSTTTALF